MTTTTQTAAAESWKTILEQKPEGAQAVIVAILKQDCSDLQTDYCAHKTTRRVVIGWRMSKRESFKELRKAAAQFAPTAHLGTGCDLYTVTSKGADGFAEFVRDEKGHKITATTEAEATQKAEAKLSEVLAQREASFTMHGCWACPDNAESNLVNNGYSIRKESVEHRETYSMGSGNYLGISHHDGWEVRSLELKWGAPSEMHENGLPGSVVSIKELVPPAFLPVAVAPVLNCRVGRTYEVKPVAVDAWQGLRVQ